MNSQHAPSTAAVIVTVAGRFIPDFFDMKRLIDSMGERTKTKNVKSGAADREIHDFEVSSMRADRGWQKTI